MTRVSWEKLQIVLLRLKFTKAKKRHQQNRLPVNVQDIRPPATRLSSDRATENRSVNAENITNDCDGM